MTSANTPPEGFETKAAPGYVPAVVPNADGPGSPGYSNTPGVDPRTPKQEEQPATGGDTASTTGGDTASATTSGGEQDSGTGKTTTKSTTRGGTAKS